MGLPHPAHSDSTSSGSAFHEQGVVSQGISAGAQLMGGVCSWGVSGH